MPVGQEARRLLLTNQILNMSIITEVRVEESETQFAPDTLRAATGVAPLADVMLEPLVRQTLLEDFGRAGDLTTNLIIPADSTATLSLVAREPGVLAGMDLARLAFRLVDTGIDFRALLRDGEIG